MSKVKRKILHIFLVFLFTAGLIPPGAAAAEPGTPQIIAAFPSNGANEKELLPKTIDGTTRYFLRVTFSDDGTLDFNDPSALAYLKDSSTVYAQGSESNRIDRDFLTGIINMQDADEDKYMSYIETYIFTRDTNKGEAYLYIPVKALREQTTYLVTLSPGLVYFPDGEENEAYSWSFTTMSTPVVTSVSVGSVGEDYDEDVPISIRGDNFSVSTAVYFNDEEAEKVKIRTDSDKKEYLEVYLPDGRDRLRPGTYDITVQNDPDHRNILYGSFSVIESGKYVPGEEYSVRGSSQEGDIISDLKVSEDTLELKSRYSDRNLLELDLDELMGPNVLVRKIKIESGKRDVIGVLMTKSRWSDITLYKLRRDFLGDGDEIVLKLGRVEAGVSQVLKTKLRDKALKSEMIQVSGEDFVCEKVVVSIPFMHSSGSGIQVMRYDEETRNWQDIGFTVNLVDRRVTVESYKPGIFAVVE